jgi:hypothetical protein
MPSASCASSAPPTRPRTDRCGKRRGFPQPPLKQQSSSCPTAGSVTKSRHELDGSTPSATGRSACQRVFRALKRLSTLRVSGCDLALNTGPPKAAGSRCGLWRILSSSCPETVTDPVVGHGLDRFSVFAADELARQRVYSPATGLERLSPCPCRGVTPRWTRAHLIALAAEVGQRLVQPWR